MSYKENICAPTWTPDTFPTADSSTSTAYVENYVYRITAGGLAGTIWYCVSDITTAIDTTLYSTGDALVDSEGYTYFVKWNGLSRYPNTTLFYRDTSASHTKTDAAGNIYTYGTVRLRDKVLKFYIPDNVDIK